MENPNSVDWLPDEIKAELNEYRKYRRGGSVKINFNDGGVRNFNVECTKPVSKHA